MSSTLQGEPCLTSGVPRVRVGEAQKLQVLNAPRPAVQWLGGVVGETGGRPGQSRVPIPGAARALRAPRRLADSATARDTPTELEPKGKLGNLTLPESATVRRSGGRRPRPGVRSRAPRGPARAQKGSTAREKGRCSARGPRRAGAPANGRRRLPAVPPPESRVGAREPGRSDASGGRAVRALRPCPAGPTRLPRAQRGPGRRRRGWVGPAMPLEAEDALYVALELAIAALSVAGNVLVCAAVGTSSALQTPTNYFLVSLAAADVAVGLFAIPFAITISLGFCTDFHSCLFLACFVLVLTQSSIFSLLAVAVDRYLAIRVPLR